jgi:hypothetical protein
MSVAHVQVVAMSTVWTVLVRILVAGMLLLGGCSNGNGLSEAEAEDAHPSDDGLSETWEDGDVDGSSDEAPDVDLDVGPDVGDDVDGDGDAPRDVDAEVRDGDGAADDDAGDDHDADALLRIGCRFVLPTRDIGYGWSGRYSIDAGKFVWRWIDSAPDPDEYVLMEWDLISGTQREVLRRTSPEVLSIPSLHGNWVAFFSTEGGIPPYEIYRVSLLGGSEERLTANGSVDINALAGSERVTYTSRQEPPDGGVILEHRYVEAASGTESVISARSPGSEQAFDGERWVAFDYEDYLHKFDLLDPGAGARRVAPYTMGIAGLAFDRDTGVLIVAAFISGESDDFRLEEWDLATDTRMIILDEPWSQVVPDVDGHVVVYQDSQAAGETYFAHQFSDLRIVDRETGVKRIVMPLDTYYGVGIWERWIAFNNYGMYGDSLIICDLVEAGYMDTDLHVVPE